MAEYYLPPSPPTGTSSFQGVFRDDYTWIPDDPANTDWINYQTWLGEGNTAQPYSAMPPPQPLATETPPASG